MLNFPLNKKPRLVPHLYARLSRDRAWLDGSTRVMPFFSLNSITQFCQDPLGTALKGSLLPIVVMKSLYKICFISQVLTIFLQVATLNEDLHKGGIMNKKHAGRIRLLGNCLNSSSLIVGLANSECLLSDRTLHQLMELDEDVILELLKASVLKHRAICRIIHPSNGNVACNRAAKP